MKINGKFVYGLDKCALYISSQSASKLNGIPFISCKIKREDKHITYNGFCYECVKIQNEGNCTHNVKLRQFIGTYTLREVSFAISLGYVITELHELLIYPRREFIYKDIVQNKK